MDELEDSLSRILSDPAELDRLGRLASQLFSGDAPSGSSPPEGGAGKPSDLLQSLTGAHDGKAALVKALLPFLHEERAKKLQKALRFARAARMAGTAFRQFGGEDAHGL